MSTNDTLINSTDTSLSTMAYARYKTTGDRTSVYLSSPERESFTESCTYQRPDGTTYTRTRDVYRWNDVYSYGEWSPVPERPSPEMVA